MCLKRKKFQEAQIDKIFDHLNMIQTIISDIEMAQINTEVIEKIAQGNAALKALNEVCLYFCASKTCQNLIIFIGLVPVVTGETYSPNITHSAYSEPLFDDNK